MDPDRLEALRRASGLSLTADGVFLYGAGAVENPRVQALFHRGLKVRPDGDVTLHVGRQWCYVRAEGVARFVERLERATDGLWLHLVGGEAARCEEGRLAFAPDGRCYAWAHPSAPPAVLLRGAHRQLATLVDEAAGGGAEVRGDGWSVPVAEIHRPPGPASPWADVC